jgi:hypothetical protein
MGFVGLLEKRVLSTLHAFRLSLTGVEHELGSEVSDY